MKRYRPLWWKIKDLLFLGIFGLVIVSILVLIFTLPIIILNYIIIYF